GTNIENMKKDVQPLLEKIEQDPSVEYSVLSIGYNSAKEIHKAKIYAKMKPKEQRVGISQEDMVIKYTNQFKNYKNMVITVEDLPPFDTGSSNAPIQIVVTGDDLDILNETTQKIMTMLSHTNGVTNIDRDYESGKPEIKIDIKRQNAQKVGVSASEIAGILGSAYSSTEAISFYEEKGRQFDITLRFDDQYRKSIDDMKKLQVRSTNGDLVSLEGIVNFEETKST
ncbi:Acriflavin resistance protein like protein, partial [Aduncisulcus paluster]